MKCLSLLIAFFLPTFVHSQPFDNINKIPVDHNFVAVDFTFIDDRQWYPIKSLANQFVKDTILLVTIPQIGGTIPAVVKMRQETTLNADKTVSFSIKLVQPNDSFCSKQWYVPQFLAQTQVAWMLFELGAYTVNGFDFIAGKGTVTRANSQTTATTTNGNLIQVWFPTGCDSPTISCALGGSSYGAINLLQTNNNVKEVGKDLYLTVRAQAVFARRCHWVLLPHDAPASAPNYHVLSAETIGYLAFQTNMQIECLEKMIWEAAKVETNYVEKQILYKNVYDYAPGLFGIVGTVTSLANTILRSSDWTTTSANFSILEDQCVTQEKDHVTVETVYLLAVGEKAATTSTYQCYVSFNSALNPTPNPTRYPTITPSAKPTILPTLIPSANPTRSPTRNPTAAPTRNPTLNPTRNPTLNPTANPTLNPTRNPTLNPTFNPTTAPTLNPTRNPTFNPTVAPTLNPTSNPTFHPTTAPTFNPTSNPTFNPTLNPTVGATAAPTTMCSNSFPVHMYREQQPQP